MFTVIKNCSSTYFLKDNKKKSGERNIEFEAMLYQTSAQKIEFQDKADHERVKHFMQGLSKRESEIINLVIYQGFTLLEASKIMGVTQGSASGYYKKAKSKIKDEIVAAHKDKHGRAPKFEETITVGLENIKLKNRKNAPRPKKI